MRAVHATKFGGPEVLSVREVPDPVAGPGEVLIDVTVADVMFLDSQLRSGWGTEFFKVEPPYVPGGAIAGAISAVGVDVDPSWIGRRVTASTAASGIGSGTPTGGYAEKSLAKVETVIEVPEELSLTQAVALAHDGKTALAVFDRAAIQPGEWVLITAAAGGLGTLLIKLARTAGANVVAAARGNTKLELATRLGAHAAIDYSEPDWADKARAATGGAGVHIVFDGAGADLGATALSVAADGARFIGYGAAGGGFAAIDPAAAAARGVTVTTLFDLTDNDADWHGLGVRVLAEASAGRLEAVVGQTFPLDQADRAHAAIESRTAIGRTILTV